jgi:hypothetical protein
MLWRQRKNIPTAFTEPHLQKTSPHFAMENAQQRRKNEWARAWRKKNPDKAKNKLRTWRLNNKYKALIYYYRSNAKKRGLGWALSDAQAVELAHGTCYWGGTHGGTLCEAGGIDRVDNNKGYTVDNCVPCCTLCNRAKSYMDEDAWEAIITDRARELTKRRKC